MIEAKRLAIFVLLAVGGLGYIALTPLLAIAATSDPFGWLVPVAACAVVAAGIVAIDWWERRRPQF